MGQITTSTNSSIGFDNPIKVVAATSNTQLIEKRESIEVDQTTFTNLSDHVPCSRTVYGMSSEISSNFQSLYDTYTTLKNSVRDVQISSYKNSEDIIGISNIVDPLVKFKAVRFKGFTTTDPSTGILTVNGQQYFVSSDFDSRNNGDVYYYHTTFKDSKGVITAKLYSYIYSCGTFHNAEVPESDEGTEISGKFYKIGYGFYDNLSTNIHDDMVDDNAAIKIHKISGLVELTSTFNDQILFLSDTISSDEIEYDEKIQYLSNCIDDIDYDLHSNYVTNKQHSEDIADTNSRFQRYVLTSNVITSTGDYKTASTTKIPSITTLLSKLEFYSRKGHKHVVTEITDFDEKKDAIVNDQRSISDGKYFAIENVCHDIKMLSSEPEAVLKTKVPDLSVICQLSNLIQQMTEPEIGTLKFVASQHLKDVVEITSTNFKGWTFPDGRTINCTAQQFKKAKVAFGAVETATSFQLPDLRNFMKLNPGTYTSKTTGSNIKDNGLFFRSFANGLKRHTHALEKVRISSSDQSTITATGTAPTGTQAKNGGKAHTGGGDAGTDVILNITIDASRLADSLSLSGTTNKSAKADDVETVPNHDVVPVLIYIGK